MVDYQCGTPESECWLVRAHELSLLFLTEAALVNAFKGKWTIIINKSQLLSACLSSMVDSALLDQNAVLKDLLPNMVQMLEEGREFAKRCTDMNYGGKLLMQNNLDALAAKIDLYLRDSEFLIECSALGEASLETRKAILHVRDLFTRLIHLLDSSLAVIREKAANVVSILAQTDECRQYLTIENAHAPLVRLLETGTPAAKEKAVQALLGLSYTRENAYAIAAVGGVSALVEVCRSGTLIAEAMAAGTIRNLANFEEMRKCLAEEHAIPVLINLVARGSHLAQEYAAESLQNLASGDERFKLAIAKHGGLQALLFYLQRSTFTKPQEIAIKALRNLSDCTANAKSLVSAGYLRHLATVLKSGTTSSMQQLAASAICNLSACIDIRKALGEAGCIPLLVRTLETKNVIEPETAFQALANTRLQSLNHCKEMCKEKEEKGLSRLARLLDPRNCRLAKRFSISAWLAISNSSTCNKRILSDAQRLESIAHANAAGIRKALDKIGSRIKQRNIFKWQRS